MEMELKFKVCDRLHYDYLTYLFARDSAGRLVVSARQDFGKLVISHIKDTPLPPKELDGEWIATLLLPQNEATQNFLNKFIYLSTQATEQLNKGLQAYFNLDFWEFVQRRNSLRERKEDIIEAFIVSRKLFSAECFDVLHKRAYRRELRDLQALKNKFLRRAYYIESLVDDPKNV